MSDFAQFANGFKSVHLRHFDVKQDDVRLRRLKLVKRNAPVNGGRCDFKIGVLRNRKGQRLANYNSVVDQQHAFLGALFQL